MNLDKETEANMMTLIQIRDDINTSPAVRIQAIQTLHKIMESMGAVATEDKLKPEDIIKKIRSKKK